MNPRNAKQEFEIFVAKRGSEVESLGPSAGVDAMLGFYREVRAEECDLKSSGDMLLYQWGIHDWGAGPGFEFDVTRQFLLPPGEDEDTWQLGLTFRFTPTELFISLGNGQQWCSSPGATEEFATFVRTHPAFAAVRARNDATVELRYDCAG